VRLAELRQKTEKSESSVRSRRAVQTATRNVQVKAAVRPDEKAAFEALARARGLTVSDVIRDYLLEEARQAGLL
jgi:hypothetical protein